jgi:hypothetical protein
MLKCYALCAAVPLSLFFLLFSVFKGAVAQKDYFKERSSAYGKFKIPSLNDEA